VIGLVVVSHSQKAADGICELAAEMGGEAPLEAAGGDDGEIGTNADLIGEAIAAADDGEGVVVLVDLGSAVMNAELAIEITDANARIADAPVLEGALNAAVEAASTKSTLESVLEKAEDAREYRKR